jgi:DNA-binding NarL/FixJ family response regulator
MSSGPITVAVVDDHPVVRAGIRAVLAAARDLGIVAEGASGGEALRVTAELRPDVLILDVNLPDMSGLEVARRLRNRGDLTPIVILTVHNDSQTVLGLLEAGAAGYVLKDEALDRLADAVRAVARGETWLSPAVAGQVVRRAVSKDPDGGPSADGSGPLSPLTPRELDVLRLLAQGLDNEAIAQRLVLTRRTVQNHISIIYDKLGVTSRTEALLYAVQKGWVRFS